MVETKPYLYPKGNESKNLTDNHKGKAPRTKRYWVKKNWTNIQGPELETKTDLKAQCTNLDGYIFKLGPRASDKFARTMKAL